MLILRLFAVLHLENGIRINITSHGGGGGGILLVNLLR